jgi:hypothetical protein
MMTLQYRRSALVVAVISVATGGCSWIFVKGPPKGHEKLAYFSCTESNTLPWLDAVWAGLNVAGSFAALANPNEAARDLAVSTGIMWFTISGYSAWDGFEETKECRQAKHLWAERQARGNTRSQFDLGTTAPQLPWLSRGDPVLLARPTSAAARDSLPERR